MFTFIGSPISALTLGSKVRGPLLAFLTLPFYLPVIIFGILSTSYINGSGNAEFYLLIGFILLIAFLLILRNRPAINETKTLKNDEELKNDLDEEFGEIGDPIEARINLAITYIEMNQTDKANDLLSQVLESEATESQKEKARKLIKEI